MPKGTCRQTEVLDYIKGFHSIKCRMPTAKELMYDLKMGRGTINRIFKALVRDSKLERIPEFVIPYRVLE